MQSVVIDGSKQAQKIKDTLKNAVHTLKEQWHVTPTLAIVKVGNDPASQIYVNAKGREGKALGINVICHDFCENISQEHLIEHIQQLNLDLQVHGIIVQLPLPNYLNSLQILASIDPKKDVDGLHPFNQGQIMSGNFEGFIPCTPLGCIVLIKSIISSIKGLNISIIGCSKLVGMPLGIILSEMGGCVTFINRSTLDPQAITSYADIIVAAAGAPHLVNEKWIKPDAIVIDVGINRIIDSQGKPIIVGDVNFKAVIDNVKAITPVPGGVGPMTIAFLLTNTVKAAYSVVEQDFASNPIPLLFA